MLDLHCFHFIFLFNSDVHEYFIRQSNRGDVFHNHKKIFRYGLRSIRYMATTTWNELPEILKNSTSKFSFKKSQKLHSQLYVDLKYIELGTPEILVRY